MEKNSASLNRLLFKTDDGEAYRFVIPTEKHKVVKELTFYIEGLNAAIRAKVSRLVRKSLSFSKSDKWHNLAVGWFFW